MEDTKSKPMQNLMNDISTKLFGMSRQDAHAQKICVICKKPAVTFRDHTGVTEYRISALCQECQDATFD